MFTTDLVAYFQPRFWFYFSANRLEIHTPLLMN